MIKEPGEFSPLKPETGLDIYAEASSATDEARATINVLKAELKEQELSGTNYAKAKQVLAWLKQKGFHYDRRAVTLDEVVARQGGSCLSASLLLGGLCEEVGIKPEYRLLINIKDYGYRQVVKNLEETLEGRGDITDQTGLPLGQNPDEYLPDTIAEGSIHPTLMIDGHAFESTAIGDMCEPEVDEPAENTISISYAEMAACVPYTLANREPLTPEGYSKIKQLLLDSTKTYPANRLAWQKLALFGREFFDDTTVDEAVAESARHRQEDSVSYWFEYQSNHDSLLLGKILTNNPLHLGALLEQKVKNQPDKQEARFALTAIARIVVAGSSNFNLTTFYLENADLLRGLYPPKVVEQLFAKLPGASDYPTDYAHCLFAGTSDVSYILRAVQMGRWPTIPKNQLIWAKAGAAVGDQFCQQKLAQLKETYKNSDLFTKAL